MGERPPPSPARGLIFDLDGVLTDTAALHEDAWRRLAADEGFDFDPTRAGELRGVSRAESLQLLLGDRIVDDATFAAYLSRKNAYYLERLEDLAPDDRLPGAVELVAHARAAGWRLAVGSSSRNARAVLARIDLLDRFDAIVDGNDVTHAKPAPEVFLIAARRIAVTPERCVVIEDAAAGVDAAHAAGMRVVGVGPVARIGHADICVSAVADITLDDLDDLVVPVDAEPEGSRR